MVMFDLSALVKYITRFTEESFSVLISLIFIYEAFEKAFRVRFSYPVDLTRGNLEGCFCEHNVTNLNDTYALPPTPTDENGTALPLVVEDYDNVTARYHETCLTYKGRLVAGHGCVSQDDCLGFGWALAGDACHYFPVPDVFLFSLFLFFGTFIMAIALRNFRTSGFFPSIVSANLVSVDDTIYKSLPYM